MASSSSSDIGDGDNGRIWIHRPFEITPTMPSAVTTSEKSVSVTTCPLPKVTPKSSPKDKLHSLHSSSNTPEKALEQMHQSKVDLYETQFQYRVPKEARTRIDRRSIRSPRGLGEVDATIYYPENIDGNEDIDEGNKTPNKLLQGICLHVHGGGWLWGDSCNQVAHRCLEMAQSMNVAVVSVEYSLFCKGNRHSEEGSVFDPINDVTIAIDWIESTGAAELNAHPSFVASGESSGAHLLLLAMLNRRDRDKEAVPLHPPVPLPTIAQSASSFPLASMSAWKCLNLVYGVYDISGTPALRADGDSSSPLCGNDLLWLYDLYHTKIQKSKDADQNQKQPTLDRKHPSLSPLYANLSYMPPALLSVGTADPLMDDTLFMANKYSSYGNHVELAMYEGGEHGIGHFGVQEDEVMGIRARRHTIDFMMGYLQDH